VGIFFTDCFALGLAFAFPLTFGFGPRFCFVATRARFPAFFLDVLARAGFFFAIFFLAEARDAVFRAFFFFLAIASPPPDWCRSALCSPMQDAAGTHLA
jgi:hypothetical protein